MHDRRSCTCLSRSNWTGFFLFCTKVSLEGLPTLGSDESLNYYYTSMLFFDMMTRPMLDPVMGEGVSVLGFGERSELFILVMREVILPDHVLTINQTSRAF